MQLRGAAGQDATVLLTDFPVALLQPLFRAMPALAHAAPAASAAGARPCAHTPFRVSSKGVQVRAEVVSLQGIRSAVIASLPGKPPGRGSLARPSALYPDRGRPGRRQQQQRAGRPGALLRAQQRPARQPRRIHRLPRQRPAVCPRDCGCAAACSPGGPAPVCCSPTDQTCEAGGWWQAPCVYHIVNQARSHHHTAIPPPVTAQRHGWLHAQHCHAVTAVLMLVALSVHRSPHFLFVSV